MKKIIVFLLMVLGLASCKKEVIPIGNLNVTARYLSMAEENVEVVLYETWDKLMRYEFIDMGLTDEEGRIDFVGLEAGWYYLEAEKEKSSMFVIYKLDSALVEDGKTTNKILILLPDE